MAGDTGIWRDELGPTAGEPERRPHPPRTGAARGWLTRVLTPGGAPSALPVPAVTLTVLGAVAFAASLTMEWQHVQAVQDVEAALTRGIDPTVEVTAHVGDLDLFGTVFLFGMIVLLAVVGTAVARPDYAARLRFGVAGGSLGLLAMLVAVAVRAGQAPLDSKPSPLDNFSTRVVLDRTGNVLSSSDSVTMTATVGQGLLLAFAAVLLPLGAVWLAARTPPQPEVYPPAAPTVVQPDEVEESADDVVDVAGDPRWRPRDPYDLTVTPS